MRHNVDATMHVDDTAKVCLWLSPKKNYDVIKWKHFPPYWSHKGQWRRALMFSFLCAWINGWETIMRQVIWDVIAPTHHDVTVMIMNKFGRPFLQNKSKSAQNFTSVWIRYFVCYKQWTLKFRAKYLIHTLTRSTIIHEAKMLNLRALKRFQNAHKVKARYPFCTHGLTEIRTWISNHTNAFVWHVITNV